MTQRDLLLLSRIQLFVIGLYLILKLIRPFVLEHVQVELARIVVLSFPNLAEGVVGVLTTTGVLLLLFRRLFKSALPADTLIYLIAVLFAAVYVLTQEYKIHNLGGNNVYDPNDVLFSAIGLAIGFVIIFRIQPEVKIV